MEAQNPDFVEVYITEDNKVSHVWVHFTEPYNRYVEVPVREYEQEYASNPYERGHLHAYDLR